MSERLPKGVRGRIRELKKAGDGSGAFNVRETAIRNRGWRTELQHHLHSEGFQGNLSDIFCIDELRLIFGWRRLRNLYKNGLITDNGFDEKKEKLFSGKDQLLEKSEVVSAIRFITQKYGKPLQTTQARYK